MSCPDFTPLAVTKSVSEEHHVSIVPDALLGRLPIQENVNIVFTFLTSLTSLNASLAPSALQEAPDSSAGLYRIIVTSTRGMISGA